MPSAANFVTSQREGRASVASLAELVAHIANIGAGSGDSVAQFALRHTEGRTPPRDFGRSSEIDAAAIRRWGSSESLSHPRSADVRDPRCIARRAPRCEAASRRWGPRYAVRVPCSFFSLSSCFESTSMFAHRK